jgi:hypothetical protein
MPAPQAAVLNAVAIAKFQSFQIQLPATLQSPTILSAQLRTKMGSLSPELFRTASKSEQDISKQRQMNEQYSRLFQGITAGIASAWQTFHSSAMLQGVIISGPVAIGGIIVGPPLQPLVYIQSMGAGMGQWETKIRQQISIAFGNCWNQMIGSASVPGLPWYPMFAAFPGPMAPPTPNTPTPIAALIRNSAPMTGFSLRNAFSNFLQGSMDYHIQFSDALATSIDASFQIWLSSTMVTNVLGTGPVPTFAPPYVPVGPVVGGTGTMTPGGFV